MDLQQLKYYPCPVDEGEGILLVDVETEMTPQTDAEGNMQYYCPEGYHVFSVDAIGSPVESDSQKTS